MEGDDDIFVNAINVSGTIVGRVANNIGIYTAFMRDTSGDIIEFEVPGRALAASRALLSTPSTTKVI